jgi:DNA uptake protein ComE-like DNA-binding protein
VLMKLPNMTDDIAWSIVDWLDPDEEPNPGGAESEYYLTRQPPYQCKNAPLDSIEELLLVKGVTPTLLFGTDRNRNGKLDPGEDDGSGYSLGWAAFLTVYSREPNVDSTGKPRINLNGNDLQQLYTDLTNAVGSDLAAFIVGYRLFGSGSSGSGGAGGGSGGGSSGGTANIVGTTSGGGGIAIVLTVASPKGTIGQLQQKIQEALSASTPPKARQRVSSLFSLVNATVSISIDVPGSNGKSQQQTVQVPSPLADKSNQVDQMAKLLDLTTTQSGTELPARVNINTAPREVLMTLPGITDATADLIIAKRPGYQDGQTPDANFATIAWLLQDETLPATTLQGLERYITARTQVYRVQSIGYFADGGPMARVEAVIDGNQGKPRIMYYRDLTDLGRTIDPRNLGK